MIEWGQDGGITNFLPILSHYARESNGFVLEIGVSTGTGSTHAFYEGLLEHPNPLLVSVDKTRDNLKWEPPVPWWHFVLGDSRSPNTTRPVVRQTYHRGDCPGLIYIDTDHDREQISAELNNWYKAVSSRNTIWLFHDTYMFGCYNLMTDAIKEFAASVGMIYEDVSTEPHGLGCMRKP